MEKLDKEIDRLNHKIDNLLKKQEQFHIEIDILKKEISRLHAHLTPDATNTEVSSNLIKPVSTETKITAEGKIVSKIPASGHDKNRVEKFIGENLINKIGIAILVIGISIGVKFAIDNNLISPLVRVILGYTAGFILLFFSWRLKKNYVNFSAVLLSGAMAAMYFITYVAFSYYGIFPRWISFGLMIFFTIFTVMAALHFDRQIIAIIGLTGAYAIPFLLPDPESKASVLFAYVAIINLGILYISYFKYWRILFYAAFTLTWAIYIYWYVQSYNNLTDQGMGLAYASLFFVLFYSIILLYKLLKQKETTFGDIILLLANSFLFFGIGYTLLESFKVGEEFSGLFTLINALLHGGIAYLLSVIKPADRSIFFFTSGLSILFLTISIPVQFDGSWVTLLWAAEALIIFWLGRKDKIKPWEILSYFLMVLSFFSLLQDLVSWSNSSNQPVIPLFNTEFLISLVYIFFFAVIIWLDHQYKDLKISISIKELEDLISHIAPAIFILVIYLSLLKQISIYWEQAIIDLRPDKGVLIEKGSLLAKQLKDFENLKAIWIVNYTMLFASALTVVNLHLIRNKILGSSNLLINGTIIFVFITFGLFTLDSLRESYLNQLVPENQSVIRILLRYISLALLGVILIYSWKTIKEFFYSLGAHVMSEFALHIILLMVTSFEVVNWMDLSGSSQSYKLGLSILWGVYSLVLILLGIRRQKKYLRIWAIVLFTVTLIKLFIYDLEELDTVSKTVVFIILGTLLLIISFMYNKFKQLIFDESDRNTP